MDRVNTVYLDFAQLRAAFENHVTEVEVAVECRDKQIDVAEALIFKLKRDMQRLSESLLKARKRNRMLSKQLKSGSARKRGKVKRRY